MKTNPEKSGEYLIWVKEKRRWEIAFYNRASNVWYFRDEPREIYKRQVGEWEKLPPAPNGVD